MKKIKLILRPDEFTSFTSYYLEEFWRESFDIELYDANKIYDKNRTLFAVWWANIDGDDPWPTRMRDQGYKIVVDNLWERVTHRKDFYWIEHVCSMWWNESLWWTALGYDSYRPQKRSNYIGLLQLRLRRPERDQTVSYLEDLLPKIMWSYMAKDKRLPFDTDDPNQGQRYMHASWYDETYCSIVMETCQTGPWLYVSEKSYKPLAYYHPFLILGMPGTLAFLKQIGFETFDNIFDESYDTLDKFEDRLKIVKSNLTRIDLTQSYNQETLAKIQHNHDHFFNSELVKNYIRREIIAPMIEYAEA